MFRSSDSVDELKIKANHIIERIESLEDMRASEKNNNFLKGFSRHIFSVFTAAPLFDDGLRRSNSNQLAGQIDIERVKLARIEQQIQTLLMADTKKSAICKK